MGEFRNIFKCLNAFLILVIYNMLIVMPAYAVEATEAPTATFTVSGFVYDKAVATVTAAPTAAVEAIDSWDPEGQIAVIVIEPDNGRENQLLIIIAAGAGVIVVAGVAVVIIKKKKHN